MFLAPCSEVCIAYRCGYIVLKRKYGYHYHYHRCKNFPANGYSQLQYTYNDHPSLTLVFLLHSNVLGPAALVSKPEACSLVISPVSFLGLGSGLAGSPSALTLVATSGLGQPCGLGSAEECVWRCRVLYHSSIHPRASFQKSTFNPLKVQLCSEDDTYKGISHQKHS